MRSGETLYCQPGRHAAYTAALDDLAIKLAGDEGGRGPTSPYVLYVPVGGQDTAACGVVALYSKRGAEEVDAVAAARPSPRPGQQQQQQLPPSHHTRQPHVSLMDAVYVSVLVSQVAATLGSKRIQMPKVASKAGSGEPKAHHVEAVQAWGVPSRLEAARLATLRNESASAFLLSQRQLIHREATSASATSSARASPLAALGLIPPMGPEGEGSRWREELESEESLDLGDEGLEGGGVDVEGALDTDLVTVQLERQLWRLGVGESGRK